MASRIHQRSDRSNPSYRWWISRAAAEALGLRGREIEISLGRCDPAEQQRLKRRLDVLLWPLIDWADRAAANGTPLEWETLRPNYDRACEVAFLAEPLPLAQPKPPLLPPDLGIEFVADLRAEFGRLAKERGQTIDYGWGPISAQEAKRWDQLRRLEEELYTTIATRRRRVPDDDG